MWLGLVRPVHPVNEMKESLGKFKKRCALRRISNDKQIFTTNKLGKLL
jgi:hypothetical protein